MDGKAWLIVYNFQEKLDDHQKFIIFCYSVKNSNSVYDLIMRLLHI